jgi:hypothetical protein
MFVPLFDCCPVEIQILRRTHLQKKRKNKLSLELMHSFIRKYINILETARTRGVHAYRLGENKIKFIKYTCLLLPTEKFETAFRACNYTSIEVFLQI